MAAVNSFMKVGWLLNSRFVIIWAMRSASFNRSLEKERRRAPNRDPFPTKINFSISSSGRRPMKMAFSRSR